MARKKIIHYRQLYLDRPEPIAFMPVAVDTSDRIYDDFLRLLFLLAHREASTLANDIPEESGHFRFLRTACLANIKGSVGLILAKASVMRSTMRISIPLDITCCHFSLVEVVEVQEYPRGGVSLLLVNWNYSYK